MRGFVRDLSHASVRAPLERCLWVCMVLVHVPALVTLWSSLFAEGADSIRLSSFVALHLATLFFGLKALIPRFLSFQTNRQSLVVIALGAILLHANAIELEASDSRDHIPVAGSILFIAGFSCVQQAVRTILSQNSVVLLGFRPVGAEVCTTARRPRELLLAANLCAPRAPPLASFLL